MKWFYKIIKYIPIFIGIYYRLFVTRAIVHWNIWNAFPEILSYIILGKIWLDFWEEFETFLKDLHDVLTEKTKDNLEKFKLDLTYKLPTEFLNFSFVIILSLIIYKWFTSSPLIISISAWVFKQINQDISNLIVLSIVHLFKPYKELPKDKFTSICGTSPNFLPSAIYIPQKSTRIEECEWGINQGIQSLKNSSTKKNELTENYFIYHSDTKKAHIKEKEIEEILSAWKHYGDKIMMFARNPLAYAKTFLWKPGAYMSDYQILSKNVTRPLTYLHKCFDTRRQKKIKTDNDNKILFQKEHVPFCCDLDKNKKLRPQENYDYFIKYFPTKKSHRKNEYLKENLRLTKLGEKLKGNNLQVTKNGNLIQNGNLVAHQGEFKKDKLDQYSHIKFSQKVKLINKHYLIDSNDYNKRVKVVLGSLFTLDNKLIAKDNQWHITNKGKIKYNLFSSTQKLHSEILPKNIRHIFIQQLKLGDKKLIIDNKGNLVTASTGKVWAQSEKFYLNFQYDLYYKKKDKFILVEENHPINQNRIKGEDFRRLPTEKFNRIPFHILKKFVDRKEISKKEAVQISTTGFIGNEYRLHKGKSGWEREYYIKDINFKDITKVIGGYVVKKSDGYSIDKTSSLYKNNKEVLPKRKAYKLKKISKNGQLYVAIVNKNQGQENKVNFLREPTHRKKIEADKEEKYFYVGSDYINYTKPAKKGYVVNEKDNFIKDEEGNIWFYQTKDSNFQTELVAYKENIKELSKQKIFVDYSYQKPKLVKRKYIAPAGSWYTDLKGNYRKRKCVGKLDLSYFNDNLEVSIYNPISNTLKSLKKEQYSIGENYIWSNKKNEKDEILEKENFKNLHGNLVKDFTLAENKKFTILENKAVKVEQESKLYPYGTFLIYHNKLLKDANDSLIPGDKKISIINQTDADTEFMPSTVSNLNSILIRNLQENKSPYLMLQPEISFGNTGSSLFAKINGWAQEMYKFMDRTLFMLFKRSTAYGKMTKFLDSYTENITLKESIPPLARSHDHWEAMKLKTALIESHPMKRTKTLLENVPSNLLLYIKRQIGWLSGDLLLLELETKFGKLLDLTRGIKWLINYGIKEAKYWIRKAIQGKHIVGYSALPASKQRIESVKRTSFNPFFFGIWILIMGIIASTFPGTLSIGTPKIAWGLFWIIITGLIIIPKFIVPIVHIIRKYSNNFLKFFFFCFLTFAGILAAKLGVIYFNNEYKSLTFQITIYLILWLTILKSCFKILFGKFRKVPFKIITLLILIVTTFLCFQDFSSTITKLDSIPSARWIPYFIYFILPSLTAYTLPLALLISITEIGKEIMDSIKKGFLEAIYSTSLLLMMVIYVNMALFDKIKFMINNPHTSFYWTPPEAYKYNITHPSLWKTYLILIAVPLTSVILVCLPVFSGVSDYSLLFYGWPIFIWSWILGPLLAYLTSKFGRDIHFNDLIYRARKEKFIRWWEDKYNSLTFMKVAEQIVYLIPFRNSSVLEKRIKIYLYYLLMRLDKKEYIKFKELESTLKNKLTREKFNISRIKEYDRDSFSEISLANTMLDNIKEKKKKYHKFPIEAKISKVLLWFIYEFVIPKAGKIRWEDFKKSSKKKIIRSICIKYKLAKRGNIIDNKYYLSLLNLLT